MKKRKIFSILLILLCIVCSVNVFAHSGRTDSSGGHKDNKNVSGLGSYHYHCGGNPPHLHTNGVCPYKSSSSSSSTVKKASVPAPTPEPTKNIVSSDIKATINDYSIPFYIYKDKGVIKISDLNSYGFDTSYNSDKKTTTIKRNADKEFTRIDGKGNVKIPVKESSIKILLNVDGELEEIKGFNGDGNMYIWFSDLGIYGTMEWDAENKTSKLTLD